MAEDVLEMHFPTEETLLRIAVALERKEANQFYEVTPAVSHRNLYRGKNLGIEFTSTQRSKIADGSFDDLYVGDYWTLNGRVYRIADINYYYNCGDTAFTKNHLVIVPDASFGDGQMNSTNVTTGGYPNSLMYTDSTSVLNQAKATIKNDFGESYVASHRIYIPTTTTTGGVQTAGSWVDSVVDLMNEPMVFGCYHNATRNTGTTFDYSGITVEKSQLALFKLNPRLIHNGRYTYWLRDVASAASFALVLSFGCAYHGYASDSYGVRPAFCIVGS